ELNFGHYGVGITLFAGLFILILAPEFYQPLRDLGTFYHAKQQAVGAAESIVEFLETDITKVKSGDTQLDPAQGINIEASDLKVLSPEGVQLVGPIS
ncbi:cysteine/glutathione ABC transporter permease/ATP-binding protein CydD, partial [Vibrio sp. 10N.222.46.A1]